MQQAVIFCGTFREFTLPLLEQALARHLFARSSDFPPYNFFKEL